MEYESTVTDYEATPTALFTETTATENLVASGVFLFAGLIALAFIAIMVVAMWRIFTKAGESGWKALIPVYNAWVFLRLGNQAGWWALVALIPLVNIVATIYMAIAAYHIGLKLGKQGWYVVLYILVPYVWLLILAFDKSTWQTATPQQSPHEAPQFAAATDSNSGDQTTPTPPQTI